MQKVKLENFIPFQNINLETINIVYSQTCYSKLNNEYNFNIDHDGTIFYNGNIDTNTKFLLLGAKGAEKLSENKYYYGDYPICKVQMVLAARLSYYLFFRDFYRMTSDLTIENPLEYPDFDLNTFIWIAKQYIYHE